MKTRNTTTKMPCLIANALRNLHEARGSTAKNIVKYITSEYNTSKATVESQLNKALKRGLEFGIFKKTSGGYRLNPDFNGVPSDSCKKKKIKRKACRPSKRKSSSHKKKSKRMSCAPKKRKHSQCNTCASLGHGCDKSVRILRDISPDVEGNEDDNENEIGAESVKNSVVGEEENEQNQKSRSPSASSKNPRTRSQSQAQCHSAYSSDNEEDGQDDE